MEYTFILEMRLPPKSNTEFINNIVGLQGEMVDETHWNYLIKVQDEDAWVDFIDIFYSSLKGKFNLLESIGVKKDDITIWYLYEYDQQCNMEFSPEDLTKLGELGITFCISCWKK